MSERRVNIEWKLKESLLEYMQEDPTFTVNTEDGASFDREIGVVLPALEHAHGVIEATASATVSAHDGVLSVPLHRVTIVDGALWIPDPNDISGERRIRLVELTPADSGGGALVFETLLTADASQIFGYQYGPGTPFAPLYVRGA